MASYIKRPAAADLLLSILQASTAATAYVLLHDNQEIMLDGYSIWLAPVDTVNVLALAGVVMAGAFLNLSQIQTYRHLKTALLALAAAALLSFAALQMFTSDWFAKLPIGVPGVSFWAVVARVAVIAFWINGVFCAFIATLSGAAITSAASHLPDNLAKAKLSVLISLCIAGLMVPLSSVYSRITYGTGIVELVTRYDEVKPFSIRLEVELKVHGEPVNFTRTVECQRPVTNREIGEAGKRHLPRDYSFPSLKSFGQTFSDGSGVFVVTPDGCERVRQKKSILPPGYEPLIGWTPDAARLDSFDLYVDGTALRRPNGEISFNRMSATMAPDYTTADKPDAFAALGWEYIWTTGTEYGAYFALKLPEELWKQHARTASSLSGQKTYGFALPDSDMRDTKGWNVYSDLHSDIRGVHISRNGAGIPREPKIESGDNLLVTAGTIVPLRRDGSGWRLYPDEAGIITFYRGLPTSLAHVALPDRIALDNAVAIRQENQPGRYVFEPGTQTLFAVGHHHFQMAKPGSVFASR